MTLRLEYHDCDILDTTVKIKEKINITSGDKSYEKSKGKLTY